MRIESEKNTDFIKNIAKLIILAFMIIFIFYYVSSAIIQIDDTYVLWAKILIYIQIFIELIVLFQALTIMLSIIDVIKEKESLFITPEKLDKYPDLDVFVTIRRVDVNILERTIMAIREQDYQQDKLHVFIIDDTPEKELSDKYVALSRKYNVEYIYDPTNIKYKAGMMNIALPYAKSEFIAFFDFDQIPQPGILTHMVAILQEYGDYAFVQTKKTFRELTNISRVWSALLYLQFFEVFERTKNKNKAVMFAGSTACFRRECIDKSGGIPEETFTEDNYLTLNLLLNGYLGIFSSRVGSIGLVPNGYYAQISQLWRWSHGGSHTLRLNFRKLLFSKKINFTQRTEYLSTLGITPVLVMVYFYIISFVPLFMNGIDSPRMMIGNMSSIALIPIALSITYVIFAVLAIWFDRNNEHSEFSMKQLPGFLVIALASNFLIFTSGIAGVLGILGPKSKRGKWSRHIPIMRLGTTSLILGTILEITALNWLQQGLSAAILLVLMAFTLLPTFFVVIIYRHPVKEEP